MPNNWFRFKQFTIQQEHAAMKVGTDGVLLGAWASVPGPGSRVLDVGTGTGLIALMIAQRTRDVWVDALEIDPSSARQANENIQNSPWIITQLMAVCTGVFPYFSPIALIFSVASIAISYVGDLNSGIVVLLISFSANSQSFVNLPVRRPWAIELYVIIPMFLSSQNGSISFSICLQ